MLKFYSHAARVFKHVCCSRKKKKKDKKEKRDDRGDFEDGDEDGARATAHQPG